MGYSLKDFKSCQGLQIFLWCLKLSCERDIALSCLPLKLN